MPDYLVKRIKSIKIRMNCDILRNPFQPFLSHTFCWFSRSGHWVFIKNYSTSEWYNGIQLHSNINYSDRSLFRRAWYIKRSRDSLSSRYQL